MEKMWLLVPWNDDLGQLTDLRTNAYETIENLEREVDDLMSHPDVDGIDIHEYERVSFGTRE